MLQRMVNRGRGSMLLEVGKLSVYVPGQLINLFNHLTSPREVVYG